MRDYQVPISIEMFIHRIGEWVSLMLGESILSLTVAVDGFDNRIMHGSLSFVILTVNTFILHYLHFSIHPERSEHHVARKNRSNGILCECHSNIETCTNRIHF